MNTSISDHLSKYKMPAPSDSKRTVLPWQDLAANICKAYNITGKYKTQLFAIARDKRPWLEGKVGNMREMKERWPEKYSKLEKEGKLGNYLFATFRKKE